MEISLNKQVALITGASRGIGAQIARQMALAGAEIALHAREKNEKVEKLQQEITEKYQKKCVILSGDFLDLTAIEKIFKQFDQAFDQLDILINNAGYEDKFALEDLPLKKWQQLLDVNLTAPFLCAQQAANRMKKQHKGVIINIQSIHDEVMRKGVSHYSVAKAGLKMFTRAAGVEWAEYGIRVVGISPGAIATDINRADIERMGLEHYRRWIPLGFVGETQDIANAAVFLASPLARYITATTLYIDGGYQHNVIRYDEREKTKGIDQN